MAKKTQTESAEAPKEEVEHIAGVKPDDGKEYLHTSIGFARGVKTKYEVYFVIPTTGIKDELLALSDECKERYDCTLVDMIESGVRQLSTRPDYKIVGFNEDGTLKENGHAAMQDLANGYKVGAGGVRQGVKTKAKKLDNLVEQAGAGSIEELEAKLARMKELEEQGLI